MTSPEESKNHKELIDQSKIWAKRARRRIDESRERIERTHHEWHRIALGRICAVCLTTQPRDEFDDAVPCRDKQAS